MSGIAKETGLAHSTIHRVIQPLVDLRLVKEIGTGLQIRLFILETEDHKTKVLVEFYTQIKRVLRQKTKGRRLERIFASKTQTRIIQYFLENPNKIVAWSTITKDTGLARSTIHRFMSELVKMKIVTKTKVKYLHRGRVYKGLFLFSLNNEGRKTKIIADFYTQIIPLLKRKTGVRI